MANQNPINGPVSRISVLFAHSYEGLRGALGIMFDRGFTTQPDDPDSGDPIYLQQPRQGCAVFLGTIAAFRPKVTDAAEETRFTTVHELGHVFNLQHDQTTPNFMHSSGTSVFDSGYYLFTPDEQGQLEVCSSDPSVRPGGSPFGSGPAVNRMPPEGRTGRRPPLALKISLPRAEAFRFEPLQLELEVAMTPGRRGVVRAPARFDPSHEAFRIFIETPEGERRRYRSPIQVCARPEVVSITEDEPFRRDLPLFGQAGGYTFRTAGLHRIWVEFDFAGKTLRSNVLDLMIRREIELSAAEQVYRDVLTEQHVSRMLFHREDISDGRGLRRLDRFVSLYPRSPAVSELAYALARAYQKRGALEREHGFRLLELVSTADVLSDHLRRRYEALAATLA